MSPVESLLTCAVAPDRATADEIVARLAAVSIDATLVIPPGARFHGLAPASCEIRVPAGQAARARAILNAER
jgi:hypothetical protein